MKFNPVFLTPDFTDSIGKKNKCNYNRKTQKW